MVRDTGGDGGSGFEGHVNASKIVVHHVERNCRRVVLDLLRKRISQPREPSHPHSHGEVLPFDKTGRNACRIWISDNAASLTARAHSGAVPSLSFRVGA